MTNQHDPGLEDERARNGFHHPSGTFHPFETDDEEDLWEPSLDWNEEGIEDVSEGSLGPDGLSGEEAPSELDEFFDDFALDASGIPEHADPEAPPRRSRRTRTGRGSPSNLPRVVLHWGHQATSPATRLADGQNTGRIAGAEGCSAALQEDMALLRALAESIIEAQSAVEAEGLGASMVPVALRLAPHQYRRLWPALPGLTMGVTGMVRHLWPTMETRRRLLLLPQILAATVQQVAGYAERKQPVDGTLAATVLAKQTGRAMRQVGKHRRGMHSPGASQKRNGRRQNPRPVTWNW